MSTNSPLHGALVHPKIPSFRSTIPGFYHTKNKRSKYKNKTFFSFFNTEVWSNLPRLNYSKRDKFNLPRRHLNGTKLCNGRRFFFLWLRTWQIFTLVCSANTEACLRKRSIKTAHLGNTLVMCFLFVHGKREMNYLPQ